MFRRVARRLQLSPTDFGGAAGSSANQFTQMMQQAQMAQDKGGCGPCGGDMSPPNGNMMEMLQKQMQNSPMGGGRMPAHLKNAMANMSSGAGGGKMGMAMMGDTVDERGKKVRRAVKMEVDMATGKMSVDKAEKQLDPDDVQLPKETVGDYTTEGATEVQFEEDVKFVQGGDAKLGGSSSSSSSSSAPKISEAEIISETPNKN
jgi:hypothetical protein